MVLGSVHMSPLSEPAHLAKSHLALISYTKCGFCSYEKAGWPTK